MDSSGNAYGCRETQPLVQSSPFHHSSLPLPPWKRAGVREPGSLNARASRTPSDMLNGWNIALLCHKVIKIKF